MLKNKEKLILVFTGELSCGKGTISKYLMKNYNASVYRFSDSLREILNLLYQEINRKNFSALSSSLRKLFGENYLAHILIEKIKKDKNKIIILDGLRKKDEIKAFKKFKNFKLIYVDSDSKTRYERLIKRNENKDDKKKTYTTFLKDTTLETEKNIRSFKRISDYTIDNNRNLKDLYKNIDNLIKNINK